jgi:hypothetical protein
MLALQSQQTRPLLNPQPCTSPPCLHHDTVTGVLRCRSEAASAWNDIVSSASHLARQACQWLPSAAPKEQRVRAALLRWLRALPLAAMCHQREESQNLPGLVQG